MTLLNRLCNCNSISSSRKRILLSYNLTSRYFNRLDLVRSSNAYEHNLNLNSRANIINKQPTIRNFSTDNKENDNNKLTDNSTKEETENPSTANGKKNIRTFEISLDTNNDKTSNTAYNNEFSIDRSSMFEPDIHLPDKPNFNDKKLNYEESTPLSNELISWIGIDGPLNTSKFMREALTHPKYGYYTSKSDDFDDDDDDENESSPIGKLGDFTTSPEISQVFGESLFIYFLSLFRNNLPKGDKVELIEIGPGKGTLMYDILSTALRNSFTHDFTKRVRHVHLVEVSPDLRNIQRKKLLSLNDVTKDFHIVCLDKNYTIDVDKKDKNTIYVSWYSNVNEVPPQEKNTSLYVICQELFDTLPIHSFEKTSDGWRERMVDVDVVDNPAYETISTIQKRPRLRFVLSKFETNELQQLFTPILSNITSNEKNIPNGSIIEISKDGNTLIQDIQSRINNCMQGSSALIIDYGYYDNEILTQSSIRAFRQHNNVHPLTTPGRVDLTADVNFIALQRALPENEHCKVLGPVTQQYFLTQLGIIGRVEAIIDDDNTNDEQAEDMVNALERLISDEKGMMGGTYKVMSIVKTNKNVEKSTPGF